MADTITAIVRAAGWALAAAAERMARGWSVPCDAHGRDCGAVR